MTLRLPPVSSRAGGFYGRAAHALLAGALVAVGLPGVAPNASTPFTPPTAQADTLTETFNGFSVGSPNGQSGWSKTGAYDHLITDASTTPSLANYPAFGAKALRISNAVTSGSFGDQTISASLANEAGETAAQNGGQSGGVRSAYFEVEWDIASAEPAAEQAGLSLSMSPDRGDGARMSYMGVADGPGGLTFTFYDFTAGDFQPTVVATNQPRNAIYNVKLQMIFVDGQVPNDIVRVYLNNTLVHTGTSWERYYLDVVAENPPAGNPPRTVDSMIFLTRGTAAPATAGKGFFIDNLKMTSGLTNVFVRADGSDTACDGTADAAVTGSGVCAVQTIARGAQLAAALGATVNVGPGTYGETAVTLPANKNTFTLKGTDANNRPVLSNGLILGAASDLRLENLIIEGADDSGSGSTNVVTGAAISNFTMKNVKIDGEGVAQRHGIAGGQFSGNISITESQFEDITNWSAFDTRSGSGGATSGTTIAAGVFSNNTMTNVKGHINFRSSITGAPAATIQVMNNTITGTGTATTSFGGIIKVFYAASATISGNTFKDVGTSGFNPGGEAPYGAAVLPRQVTNLTIENNLFEGNNQAIAIEPRNTTSGGFADGVLSQGSINNNTFLNNKYAVYIPATLHPTSNLPGLAITNNSFASNVANAEGVHNGSTLANAPATTNWWGSSSGPTHVSNVGGAGLITTNNVTFSPFLTRGTDTSAAIGFQPDTAPITTAFVRTDGNSTECDGSANAPFSPAVLGACAVATVQEGVDNVQAGGTVNVAAGTYNGGVNVNKSVSIIGAGMNTTILDGQNVTNSGIATTTAVNGLTVKTLKLQNYVQDGVFMSGGVNIANVLFEDVEASNNGRHGFYITPNAGQTVTDFTLRRVTANGNNAAPAASQSGRGVWLINGTKTNITIENGTFNNNRLVGIDLSEGNVANAVITGNTVTGNGDSGIGVLGPKTAMNVANNTVTNNGRFGIEIKNPDGPTSGTSPLVVQGNTVSRTTTATDLRDHAGIVVMRRGPQAPANVDQPAGVLVQNNDVSGFRANASGTTGDGFCIVVEGVNMTVKNNNVTNCDVGVQMQKANTANVQSTPAFDRGDAADYSGVTELNNVAASNTIGVRGVGLTATGNATRNWWGANTGPTNANNAGGTGSSLVGANINFSPWLTDGTDTQPAVGFQPNLTLIGVNTQTINVSPTTGLVTTENGGTAQFSITIASQPTGNVTIGLASSNTNEGTVNPASVTFTPANYAVPQVVTVTGVSVGAPNGNVAYTIVTAPATSTDPLFNGVNPDDVSVTNNAASTPTVSIADASVDEGTVRGNQLAFNVTLSAAHSRTVKVDFTSTPVTATHLQDFIAGNGTITFNPGETTKQIFIETLADNVPEPDETFTVTLSNPVEAALGRATATGTIINDDAGVSAPCSPRPDITVTTQAIGARQMQVTVKAGTDSPNGANSLVSIRFGNTTNASVQMAGQASIGTSPITFQAGTRQITFTVQQINPGAAFHVPFTVNDTCGGVEKFVGGGKDAVAN